MKILLILLPVFLFLVNKSDAKMTFEIGRINMDTAVNAEKDIRNSLQLWNDAAKERDIEKAMSLFDDSENILLVGSDSGEICKGKEQISKWLKMLFDYASFSWELDRVDIDYSGNTAWVFTEGKMVVTPSNGKTRKVPYRFTGILVKRNNVWKWRLFNGSNPRPE